MSNDRATERVTLAGGVTGEVMVFQPMTILDISSRGAQIETSFPLQVDSLHDFRLMLDGRSVVVKGRIAHCQVAQLTDNSALYHSGIEFVQPSDHVLRAIGEFIQHLKSGGTRPLIADTEIADEG